MGWLSNLFGGGDAPDTSGINQAAVDTAALSREALDWAKQQYADQAPERAAASARASAVADAQVGAMNFATDEARRLSQRSQSVFEPLENRIVADSQAFDTPERRAQASAEARADVESAFGSAQDANTRALRRTGSSSGGRAQALMADWALNKAKASAGASTAAVKGVEQQGYARRMDAVGLGKGVVGSQATQQQIATQSGNGAVGAGGAALAASNSGIPMMQGAYSTGLGGLQTMGNLYGQAAKITADANAGNNAAMMQGIGGIAQGIGSYYGSSKKLKHKNREIDEDEALEAVNKTPVEGWDYKQGVADSSTHVGPYAEDVQRNSGDRAAPRGVMVSMTELGKQNTNAIKALTRQIEEVEKQIAELEAA